MRAEDKIKEALLSATGQGRSRSRYDETVGIAGLTQGSVIA